MASKRDTGESSGSVLQEINAALGGVQTAAYCMHVSRTALGRYTNHNVKPPMKRRVQMLHALVGRVQTALIARLATSFDVPEAEWPEEALPVAAPTSAFTPALADAVDLAVFASAERNDVSPSRARQIALDVLAKVVELGATSHVAHAALIEVAARRTQKPA